MIVRYLPTANLSICGVIVVVGVIVGLDDGCPDIGPCVDAGLLQAPDANGTYVQRPVVRRSCCGG